jgi:hypothetical protein
MRDQETLGTDRQGLTDMCRQPAHEAIMCQLRQKVHVDLILQHLNVRLQCGYFCLTLRIMRTHPFISNVGLVQLTLRCNQLIVPSYMFSLMDIYENRMYANASISGCLCAFMMHVSSPASLCSSRMT